MQDERLWKWVSAGLALIVVVLLLCAFIMRPSDNGRYSFSAHRYKEYSRAYDVLAFDTRTGVVWQRVIFVRDSEGLSTSALGSAMRAGIPWIQFTARIPQVDNATP